LFSHHWPALQNYQVDWEALLQQSPADFISSLSSWLLPAEALMAPGQSTPVVPEGGALIANGVDAPSAESEEPAAVGEQGASPGAEAESQAVSSPTAAASQGTKVMDRMN